MNTRPSTVALFITIIGLVGCDRPPASKPSVTVDAGVTLLPTVEVALAGRAFQLEVADTEARRETGLMRRTSMPIDHGMIFAFPDVAQRNFWMKNTLIPLDIAYLDANGTVLNVLPMLPKDLTNIPSTGPAKYAIEINGGIAEKIGLHAGDNVTLPAIDAK